MQHASLAVPPASNATNSARGVRAPHLLAAIVALLGADNLLLLRFLGVTSTALWFAACSALAILLVAIIRLPDSTRVPARRLLGCCVVGVAVMVLGGEGRLL